MKSYFASFLLIFSFCLSAQSDYNGPLFIGRSGVFYIIIDGQKREIPNKVLYKYFNWQEAIGITDEQLEFLPNGSPISKDAGLVQAKDDPKIYFISNGIKYLISNPDAFNHFGFVSNEVDKIKSLELDNFVDGSILFPKSTEQLEYEALRKTMLKDASYLYRCDVLRRNGSKDSGTIRLKMSNSYDACPSYAYFLYNHNGFDRIERITPETVDEFLIYFKETKKTPASTTRYDCRDGYFVPVYSDDGPLLIYFNPFPSHINVESMRSKKLADKIYGAVENAASSMNNSKDKNSYQKDGKINFGKFIEDAGESTLEEIKKDQKEITKTLELIIKQNEVNQEESIPDYSEFDGMDPIWLSEYILEDKETGHRTIVYRDNYVTFLKLVKEQCPQAWQSFASTEEEPERWMHGVKVLKMYNQCLK